MKSRRKFCLSPAQRKIFCVKLGRHAQLTRSVNYKSNFESNNQAIIPCPAKSIAVRRILQQFSAIKKRYFYALPVCCVRSRSRLFRVVNTASSYLFASAVVWLQGSGVLCTSHSHRAIVVDTRAATYHSPCTADTKRDAATHDVTLYLFRDCCYKSLTLRVTWQSPLNFSQ